MKIYLKKFSFPFLLIALCFCVFISVASAAYSVDMAYLNSYSRGLNIQFFTNKWGVRLDADTNRWRIQDTSTGAWYVKADGDYPYSIAEGDAPSEPGTAPADVPATPSVSKNKFVDARNVKWSPLVISSYDALGQLVTNLQADGIPATLAKNTVSQDGKSFQVWYVANVAKTAVYCDSQGRPFVASVEPAATDIDFNIIVDNSKTNSDNTIVVDNTKVLDTSNNVMYVINENGDKIAYNIDSLYYDGTTNSYTANTYQYNDNSKTYNYYTWNITYNIQNTYINYIGSNSAYEQEEYKYYYQLPDGRSSEDMTADEVAALSFQFADVKNYARSATDTSLRALYHFDGNTEDSGYFSTQTKFTWLNNASITYMDSAGFNGALYLDERAHEFDIDLPSNFGSGDFSIQWRHYQASQPDTVDNRNNFLSLGGVEVLRWDEQNFYFGSATPTIPIGNWHELALVRYSGTLYFYVNGLKVAQKADSIAYQGKLMFTFGATSRAYTMLDELRVVNFAVAKSGASYQCATVPYDTNLVLVLPDSAFPIADEYWEFNNAGNKLSANDFTNGIIPSGWTFGGTSLTLPSDYGALRLSSAQASNYNSYINPENISLPNTTMLTGMSMYIKYNYVGLGDATFSVYDTAGNTSSITFNANTMGSRVHAFFSWGALVVIKFGSDVTLCIIPSPSGLNLRYVELKQGLTPNVGHKKVSDIYSSEDIKPNTAAIQSSIPVNGYTVGGVRPTFPARGNVWFPVSGSRITGCYIYDGSMWLTAGCRYYTGTRWIPIYAFDIYTLADCWDVSDAVDAIVPITSEYDFWNWWKREWLDFRAWLKTVMSGGGSGSVSDCEHTYISTVDRESTCSDPGLRTYTCTKCGHTYTELIDALGHDWQVTGHVPDVLDEEGNVVEKGYDELTCSRCGDESKDYGEGPVENDVFDALGDLIADGITWILDKLTELADSLHGITDIFTSFAEKVQTMPGEYPLFFAAFVAIIPDDLSTVLWFSVIVFVVVAVWKKWSA